jgi:hypothetical protein
MPSNFFAKHLLTHDALRVEDVADGLKARYLPIVAAGSRVRLDRQDEHHLIDKEVKLDDLVAWVWLALLG